MAGKAFIDHLSTPEHPRQAWKAVYPLPEILLVVLCAALGGAEEFVEIARWGQGSPTFFGASCPASVGSSRTTRNDVMNALPAELFAERFTAWRVYA